MPELPKSIKLPRQLFQQRRGALSAILQQSRALLTLQEKVRSVVPGDIYVANLKDGVLYLVTPSASLATRIKYSQRSLIGAIRSELSDFPVKSLKVSVRPVFHEKTKTSKPAIPPSEQNARQIADTAKYIEDKPLREALMRLSNRGKSIN